MLEKKLMDQYHFYLNSSNNLQCLVLDKISFGIFRIPYNIGGILEYFKNVKDVDLVCSKFNISTDQFKQILARFKSKIPNSPEHLQNKDDSELKSSLKILRLVVTNICNLKCKYCYADEGTYHSEKRYMTKEDAKIIIDKILSVYNGIEEICFFGGEPLLNVDTIEFVCKYLSEKFRDGLTSFFPRFSIVSNGTIMNDRIIKLINEYKIYTTISLDGPKEINDELRVDKAGFGSFQRIESNINRLRQSTPQPSMIECTYTSLHAEYQYTNKELLTYFDQGFGVKTVVINPVEVSGKNATSKTLLLNESQMKKRVSSIPEQFNEFLEQGIQHTGVLRFITSLHNKVESASSSYHCNAGIQQLTVNTTGEVYPCQLFIGLDNNRFSMGNILEDEVYNESFKNVQKVLIKNSKQNSPKCKQCPERRLCDCCIATIFEKNNVLAPCSPDYCAKRKRINEQYMDSALGIYLDKNKYNLLINRIKDLKEDFKLRGIDL
ncbi:radical SAM protein [Paenibacillus sp. FSL L8-0663]|uniref:radical SAM/SPASM domain-containing protein n=1 Tax=Paenibacillus sp. FSL L8-0663 TaxID=2921606 RepID=UPI0030FB761F